MQLSSSSYSVSRLPVWAAVAASCFSGVAPANTDFQPTRRQQHEMFKAVGGTAALAANMRETGGLHMYSGDVVAGKSLIRETTEQEHVIAELRGWLGLQADWDGEGAMPPVARSVTAASDFVCLLPPDTVTPAPMLHASGRAGLCWSGSNGSYGELEFLTDGTVAYFFTHSGGKHKGVVGFDGISIPTVIAALISYANAA